MAACSWLSKVFAMGLALASLLAICATLVAAQSANDQLHGYSPEKLREIIQAIFAKIDTNANGQLDEEELAGWAEKVKKASVVKNSQEQWLELGLAEDDMLKWDHYRNVMFGVEIDDDEHVDRSFIYQLIERDRRKWSAADVDGDESLTLEEFAAFLYPEGFSHMQEVIVLMTIEEIDIDSDGFVSEDEFIGEEDSVEEEGAGAGYDSRASEEEWLVEQRRQFREVHDTNHDGLLDLPEVRKWLDPAAQSPYEAEAKHVLYSCDADHDGTLSLSELLAKPDLFTQTMLTDYGNALRYHDEL